MKHIHTYWCYLSISWRILGTRPTSKTANLSLTGTVSTSSWWQIQIYKYTILGVLKKSLHKILQATKIGCCGIVCDTNTSKYKHEEIKSEILTTSLQGDNVNSWLWWHCLCYRSRTRFPGLWSFFHFLTLLNKYAQFN